jgi:Ser/Thr protein kinase RdoA (MazF antagonist)
MEKCRQTPAVHDPLPIGRLREALRAWDLEAADIVGITPGVTADVFLVMRGPDRWVAKFNYDYREHFEVGLRASRIVQTRIGSAGFDVAVPIPTTTGLLTELVEWPAGTDHPLALLTYVRGDPISGGDLAAPQLLGDVCGRVHAALLDVSPTDVGLQTLPEEPDGNYPDRDAGPYSWLHPLWRELEQRAWALRSDLRHAISVWDGPDIRCRQDRVGLLDFGHCGWHSIVHVVANRSLSAALNDQSRLASFLTAVEQHLPLTQVEHEHLVLHRLRNAAIYARWVAVEKVARGDPGFNDEWFGQLLDCLRRELPLVDMTWMGSA